MKISLLHFFLLGSILVLNCLTMSAGAQQRDELSAAGIEPFGRYRIYPNKPLELLSSGVHFGYTFEGTVSQVYAFVPKGARGYLHYELDGKYKGRIPVSTHTATPITIKAPTAGKHTVWIYKATEAHAGPVMIEKVRGHRVVALKRPAAPIIEFIGNSITSGSAADPLEVPCGSGAFGDQHNAYMAYGPRVARALGVNFLVSSVSGYGIYRNANSNGPTLPQVYEKIDFLEGSKELWDFEVYTPQVVSIALGTNDLSPGDGPTPRAPFDQKRFIREYVKFIETVKDIYPEAGIALLSSPMLDETNRKVLESSLRAIKLKIDSLYPKDKPVALYFFTPRPLHGCAGHPSVDDHAVMAKELEPFFRKLLHE